MIERPEGFIASHANRGICGVIATAICANVSYQVAWATLKQIMIEDEIGQRFRGGTYKNQRNKALSRLAVKHEEVKAGMGWKVWEFVAHVCEPGVMYMVCFKGHVFCIKDAWVIDQSYSGPIQAWKVRNKKVTYAIKIIGKGW